MRRHPRGRSTTCCRSCARATRSSCARRSRRARPSSSPATSSKHRGFTVGEEVFVAHVPGADRRRPLPRGDRDAAVHRRRRRRALRRARGRAVRASSAPPIVQTTPVQAELAKIWTNILRYATFALPEPADDGLRAVRRERLRRDRPDQPRLPARRHGAARASPPAPACARTSPSPRSARTRPGMLLAVSRVQRVACRCSSSRASSAALGSLRRPQGRRARPRLQARHRRRARLAVAQADPAARARAGRRRASTTRTSPTPTRRSSEAVARRRRRRRRHQPLRVLHARRAAPIIERARRRRARRRPLERCGRRPRCSRTPTRSRAGGSRRAASWTA